MKVIEMLQIGQKLLEMLQKSCIKVSDIKYIGMYNEYSDMVANGNKISYIAAVLSTKYNISERQFFYVIKRFEQDCKISAM
jgi:hypothetical protein